MYEGRRAARQPLVRQMSAGLGSAVVEGVLQPPAPGSAAAAASRAGLSANGCGSGVDGAGLLTATLPQVS